MGLQETLINLFVSEKTNNTWSKIRDFGSGSRTYLAAGSMVLSGAACMLSMVAGKDLAWVVANWHTLASSNCWLLISGGSALWFKRQAMAGIENKLDQVISNDAQNPAPPAK